jgi:hypothetical protein
MASAMIAIFCVLNAADAYTTEVGLSNGGREINGFSASVIARVGVQGYVVAKTVVSLCFAVIAIVVWRSWHRLLPRVLPRAPGRSHRPCPQQPHSADRPVSVTHPSGRTIHQRSRHRSGRLRSHFLRACTPRTRLLRILRQPMVSTGERLPAVQFAQAEVMACPSHDCKHLVCLCYVLI